MKASMVILALFGFSSVVMAQEGSIKTQGQQAPIEQYTYATHLDVAAAIAATVDQPVLTIIAPQSVS